MAGIDLVIVEFIILAVVCLVLIRYFSAAVVTYDVAVVVYLSWVLGFAGILLLPYDLSMAIVDTDHGNKLNNYLVNVWNFIYWR